MTGISMAVRGAVCAALAVQSVHAAHASADCIQGVEAEALFLAVAPVLIDEMITTCTGTLATDSYLLGRGPGLSDRFATAAAGREEQALVAFKRLGRGDLDETQSALASSIFKRELAQKLAKELKAEDCQGVDELFASLDPLPPINFARAIVAIIRLAETDRKPDKSASKKKDDSGAILCPASTKP